jgi:hypothetical protein
MKYLPKETCEYLVSLGCTSESGASWWWNIGEPRIERIAPASEKSCTAFAVDDILHRENLEKMFPNRSTQWIQLLYCAFAQAVYTYPETWPKEVSKLIQP